MAIQRSFCLGSEWLYYKIYCGAVTADNILIEFLYPIIKELKNSNHINCWFFIRYSDPHQHIRLRLQCKSDVALNTVVLKFSSVLDNLLQSDIVWKIQADTYERELERYGNLAIIETEKLFQLDSDMVCGYLASKSSFERPELQLLFSFVAINSFLDTFSVTLQEKHVLMEDLYSEYTREFDAGKLVKKQLDQHYRQLKTDAEIFLSGQAEKQFPLIFALVSKKEKQSRRLASSINKKIQIPNIPFLKSHVHMMMNRQYNSAQRHYEYIIYDHLYKYYKAQFLRMKSGQ